MKFLENPDAPKHYPVEDISIEEALAGTRRNSFGSTRDPFLYLWKSGCSNWCRWIDWFGIVPSDRVKFKPKELVMIDLNENSLYMLEQDI